MKIGDKLKRKFKRAVGADKKDQELHSIGILDKQTGHKHGVAAIAARLRCHDEHQAMLKIYSEEIGYGPELELTLESLINSHRHLRKEAQDLRTDRQASWSQAVKDGTAAGEKWAKENNHVPLEELKSMTLLQIAQKYLVLL